MAKKNSGVAGDTGFPNREWAAALNPFVGETAGLTVGNIAEGLDLLIALDKWPSHDVEKEKQWRRLYCTLLQGAAYYESDLLIRAEPAES